MGNSEIRRYHEDQENKVLRLAENCRAIKQKQSESKSRQRLIFSELNGKDKMICFLSYRILATFSFIPLVRNLLLLREQIVKQTNIFKQFKLFLFLFF